jgi:phospholipid transport system substrate-binding protein
MLVLLAQAVSSPAEEPPGPASAPVDSLHAALLEIMREADALGFAGRRERVAGTVASSFDMGTITRLVMGRHWDGLDESARSRMRDAMMTLTVATYAARFDGFDGETFVQVSEQAMSRGRRLVRSELRRTGGEPPIQLDYVVQPSAGAWRIVNVLADGVSELSLKRAQYGSMVEDEGIDRLIARVDEQAVALARESSP